MEKIAIIGANEFQNALILKAKAMGLETHVFAWQSGDPGEYTADYFYPISVANQNFICDECRRIKPAAVISVASDLAMVAVGYVARELGLISNSQRTVHLTANKPDMRRAFREAGLPQPDFVEVGDMLPMEEIRALGYPLVVKPSDRSGGRGVVRVESEQALRRSAAEARDISFERRAIVEQYIAGKYYSAESLSFQGTHYVLAITENEVIESAGAFYEVAHRQPAKLHGKMAERLEALARAALDALEVTVGASHTEFVVAPDGQAYLIEVSSSMGGDYVGSDLVPLSTGLDYLKMTIDAARGRAPELKAAGRKLDAEVRFLTCAEDLERWNAYRLTWADKVVRSHIDGDIKSRWHSGKQRCGYYITAQRPREMGGYLPLELERGREYFRGIPTEQLRRLNSGRTAIWYAVRSMGAARVYVPHFCNPSVADAVREAGAEVVYYRIDESFQPLELCPGEDDAIVLVNFYGLMDAHIRSYSEANPAQRLIVDNAGAFFCPPILRSGIYNVYSCRKFVGVPDGGYLIGSPLAELALAQDCSASRAGFLMDSIEQGTNGSYRLSQENERALAQQHLKMSELTLRLLDSANYDRIRDVRRKNFTFLHETLCERNELRIELADCVPQYYPLLCGERIREQMIKQRVYIPMLWRKCLTEEFEGSVEYRYSDRICCLPIDQRYSESDMRVLSELVLSLLN